MRPADRVLYDAVIRNVLYFEHTVTIAAANTLDYHVALSIAIEITGAKSVTVSNFRLFRVNTAGGAAVRPGGGAPNGRPDSIAKTTSNLFTC